MSTLPMPLQNYLITPLMKEMDKVGREDMLMTPAGQGAGGISEIKTAKQVLDDMINQAIDVLTYKLASLVEL
jgi:NAD(P)H-dependent flavin oxidoreductase YrpB (nitropropane dioxygenase family)